MASFSKLQSTRKPGSISKGPTTAGPQPKALPTTPSALPGPGNRVAPENMLALQRTAGNRAAQRWLTQQQTRPKSGGTHTNMLQRQPQGPDSRPEVSAQTETAIESERGQGQLLPKAARQPVEQALGQDLGGVQIHANAQAHRLNEAVGARAFTTGRDIFFREGAYQPGSPAGQKLIAHELTHVAQQSGAGSLGPLQREPTQDEGNWHDPAIPGDPKLEMIGLDIVGGGQGFKVIETGKQFWYYRKTGEYKDAIGGIVIADLKGLTAKIGELAPQVINAPEEPEEPDPESLKWLTQRGWEMHGLVETLHLGGNEPVLRKQVVVKILRISGANPSFYKVRYAGREYSVDRAAVKQFMITGSQCSYSFLRGNIPQGLDVIVQEIEKLPVEEIKKHFTAIHALLETLIAPMVGDQFLKVRRDAIPSNINNTNNYQTSITNCAKTSMGALTGQRALEVEKRCVELVLGQKIEEADQETLMQLRIMAMSPINAMDEFCMLMFRNLDVPLKEIITPVQNINDIKNKKLRKTIKKGFKSDGKGISESQVEGVKLYAAHALKQAGIVIRRADHSPSVPVKQGKAAMLKYPRGTQFLVGVWGDKLGPHWLYADNYQGKIIFFDYQQDRLLKLAIARKELIKSDDVVEGPTQHEMPTVPDFSGQELQEVEGTTMLFLAFVPRLDLVRRVEKKLDSAK